MTAAMTAGPMEGAAIRAAMAAMARPWAWGEADCCTAACSAFAALHGIDPMQPLRGRYRCRAEAEALIAARGGWDALCAGLAVAAGLRPVAPGAAQAGDLGLMVTGLRTSLVLCVEPGRWAGKAPRGMALANGRRVVRAWRACPA